MCTQGHGYTAWKSSATVLNLLKHSLQCFRTTDPQPDLRQETPFLCVPISNMTRVKQVTLKKFRRPFMFCVDNSACVVKVHFALEANGPALANFRRCVIQSTNYYACKTHRELCIWLQALQSEQNKLTAEAAESEAHADGDDGEFGEGFGKGEVVQSASIFLAAKSLDVSAIKRAVMAHSIPVNQKNKYDCNALFYAVQSALKGAAFADKDDPSAGMVLQKNAVQSIKLLMALGADPYMKNNCGKGVMDFLESVLKPPVTEVRAGL